VPPEARRAQDVPGRVYEYFLSQFVSAEAHQDDGEPFDQKMQRLVAHLREQQAEAAKRDAAIAANFKELGFWEPAP